MIFSILLYKSFSQDINFYLLFNFIAEALMIEPRSARKRYKFYYTTKIETIFLPPSF